MSQSNQLPTLSFKMRLLHMGLFELMALILVTPVSALLLHRSLWLMGSLSLSLSLLAMLWNLLFNWIYDRIEVALGGHRFQRRMIARIGHTLLFEGGLLLATVPILAVALNVSWHHALVIDLGYIAFFLVYTFGFNYTFDTLFYMYWSRRQANELN